MTRKFASPVCYAAEIAPDYFDPLGVDAQQKTDVDRWRKAKRAELIAARSALSGAERMGIAGQITDHLESLIARIFPNPEGKVISGYWPIKSEPDLRECMLRCQNLGMITALPVVEKRAAPLTFRPWQKGCAMERGFWNIPVPATTATVVPDIVIAPLVGWDASGYRLGYGGSYFDRTLAHIKPFKIGTGHQGAQLPTIFPQPHDIALDAIITEKGIAFLNRSV